MIASIRDILTEQGSDLAARLSFEDRAEINDVLDAAVAWSQGMPVEEFARIGTMLSPSGRPSPGFTRYMATRASMADDRYPVLLRTIDALLRFQGLILTTHGLFTREDLAEAGDSVSGGYRHD